MYTIGVSGVDGSGKSTLCANLYRGSQQLQPLRVTNYLWMRYSPRRNAQSAPSSTVSENHTGHPMKALTRVIGLGEQWTAANSAMYRRQLKHQLRCAQHSDLLIVDRFTIDFLVDQISARSITTSSAVSLIRSFPQVNHLLILDAPDQTLLERLKPGDSPDRLLRQADIYRNLADALGVPPTDATEPNIISTILSRWESELS